MKGLKNLQLHRVRTCRWLLETRLSTEVYSLAFMIKFDYSMLKFHVNATVSRALRNMVENRPSVSF